MNPALINPISRRFGLILRFTVIAVMLLSVLLGILVYTIATIKNEQSNAILIDVVSRQRMLFQTHINEVLLTSHGVTADYTSTRERIRSTLKALLEGGSIGLDTETGQRRTVPPTPSEEILKKLREQQNYFDKVTELADNFLFLSPDHPEFGRNLQILHLQNSALMRIADGAVKQLNDHSESNLAAMVSRETIIAFFVGLLGIFMTGQGIRAGRKVENEIAERKRAETNLHAAEQMYRQVLDAMADMIFVKDKNFRLLWGNKAFRDYYNMTNDELKGILDSTFNEPEFTKEYHSDDAQVFNTGNIFEIPEEPVTRHDGKIHLFHTIKTPLFDENGEVEKLVGVARDITERKQAELERTERELLLRLIFETGPGCIKRVAADGTLLHMNPGGLELVEADTEEDALGLSVFDLVVPEHLDTFRHMHQKVLEGEPQTLQFEVQGLKGGRRWMETYAVPFSNPLTNEVEHLAVTHDITERKTSEERTKQLSIQNELILSSAGDGIYGLNLQGQTTFVNPAGAKLLGYSPQELIGLSMHTAIHHTKSDGSHYPQEECPMYAAFTDGTIHKVEDEVLWRKDGTSMSVEYSSMPIWQDGMLVGAVVTFRDITERKQAEEALKKSRQDFQTLVDSLEGVVWEADFPSYRFTFVSQQAERLLGYPIEQWLTQPNFFCKRLHESDQSWVVEYCREATLRKENHEMEYRFLHANGEEIWLKDLVTVVVEHDQPVKLRGVMFNITEIKKAEKALRDTEQMYGQILDSISDLVFTKDQNFRMLWANKAFREYYNMTNEELKGILDSPINEPDFTRQYNEADAYVLNTGKILDIPEEPVTRHDGQIHLFHTIKAPLFSENGEVVRLVGVARDITERKQAEEIIRKNERKFRAIYEQAPTGIAILDSINGRFTQINQKYCDIVGYSEEEMLNLTFQELTHPDDLQADLFQMQRLLADEIRSFQMEKRYIRKDGEIIWVSLICVPLWLEHADPRLHIAMVEDITERKRWEKALQESEERFRVLYEDNPSMYFTVAQDGKILSVNRFGAQQLGHSVEELVGQPVIDLFLDEEKSLVQQRFEDCLRSPLEGFSWEFRKVRKDGSIVWVKEVARAVHNKDGEIEVLIVCEDISERMETEKKLQESKELTESILGQLPKGFAYRCLNNKEWTVIYVSDGIEEVTGYPVSDLLSGRITYDTLMAPGENERVWPMVQDALAKHLPYENEHQIITRDGKKKWILARGSFVFDKTGKLLYLDGLNVDITEHKQIQQNLRTSEARFRTLVEHMPFCIHEIELNGIISSMNKAGQKMIGIENESQAIGHSFLKFSQDKDHAQIREYFEQALQGKPVGFEFDVTTHERMKVFTKNFIPIRGRDGGVLKIVGILEDITERRQAEQRLHESETKRIEALRQSDELKSALLSSVSHELRTPLTAIKSSVFSIIGNVPSGLNEVQQELLKGVDREINYMSRLVDNLLDMSQIEAGTLVPHREWHPLEDLVEGALRRTEQLLETQNIEIHIPEDVPPVFVDAVGIQQVLINLLDNAVKYSSSDQSIQIHVRVGDQRIEVKVSNAGEAIQAQDLERIFERFYRRRLPHEQTVRGTGLGLAICKGIIEAHGGRIWAESIGRVVTITFTVPMAQSMAEFSLEGLQKG